VQLFVASALVMLLSPNVCRRSSRPSRYALPPAADRRVDHMWISPGPATTSGRNAIRNGHPKWLMAE
jgi:hypothetical protein